jgi:hypothetical protein
VPASTHNVSDGPSCATSLDLRHCGLADPDDWELVRRKPRPPLVCPEPSCGVELISYQNVNNQYNPRIFKFKSINRSCDHWPAGGGGGGPESGQHGGGGGGVKGVRHVGDGPPPILCPRGRVYRSRRAVLLGT